jgi:hypothetical protein
MVLWLWVRLLCENWTLESRSMPPPPGVVKHEPVVVALAHPGEQHHLSSSASMASSASRSRSHSNRLGCSTSTPSKRRKTLGASRLQHGPVCPGQARV